MLSEWLSQETINSRDGRNRVLDDYAESANYFSAGVDTGASVDINKSRDHHNRFAFLMGLRIEPYVAQNDFFIGKIIHHSLMFVSGGRRRECLLVANSQEEYEQLRYGTSDNPAPPTGVDMYDVVKSEVKWFEENTPGLEEVIERSKGINDQMLEAQLGSARSMIQNGIRVADLAPGDEAVEQTRERQRLGIALAVSHIGLVAHERGQNLARVPFLEPESISDVSPDPYYPFATI